MKLYDALAGWYHLVTAPHEYDEEAAAYIDAIVRFSRRPVATVLDVGAGGGCNASHLRAKGWSCVLTDISPRILEESRRLNPDCEHVEADMRTMRLGRVFDAVLVHDSICYMTTEADLALAIETAFAHCAPGGVCIFAPDELKDTFESSTDCGGNDDGQRGARYLEWKYDPDPDDTTYVVDYAFLLRDGDAVEAVHDRHVEGLFPRATWLAILERAGFHVELGTRPVAGVSGAEPPRGEPVEPPGGSTGGGAPRDWPIEQGSTSQIFVAVRP